MDELSNIISDFNVEFFKRLSLNGDLNENICFSATLIYYALVALHIGSKGKSAIELKQLLGYDYPILLENQNVALYQKLLVEILNIKRGSKLCYLIMSKGQINENYRKLMQDIFEAEFKQINMSNITTLCKEVNTWVSKHTEGKIPAIITENDISDETLLLFTNTIFFKSKWFNIFETGLTMEYDFFLMPGKPIKVQMMTMTEEAFYFEDSINCAQVLIKPFCNEAQIGIFALPARESNLKSLIDKLSTDVINVWLNKSLIQNVYMYIPKFKLRKSFQPINILQDMNHSSVFSANCDFSGITNDAVFLSNMLHTACVEVDEEGAVAAASNTCALDGFCEYFPKTYTFEANRPFIFLIFDITLGYPLFMNAIIDPTEN